MDEQPKRKGRGLGKHPALFQTSIRLPREVLEYFNKEYPYRKQAKIRDILIDYVRSQTQGESNDN